MQLCYVQRKTGVISIADLDNCSFFVEAREKGREEEEWEKERRKKEREESGRERRNK